MAVLPRVYVAIVVFLSRYIICIPLFSPSVYLYTLTRTMPIALFCPYISVVFFLFFSFFKGGNKRERHQSSFISFLLQEAFSFLLVVRDFHLRLDVVALRLLYLLISFSFPHIDCIRVDPSFAISSFFPSSCGVLFLFPGCLVCAFRVSHPLLVFHFPHVVLSRPSFFSCNAFFFPSASQSPIFSSAT